jgi:hypothetical protein
MIGHFDWGLVNTVTIDIRNKSRNFSFLDLNPKCQPRNTMCRCQRRCGKGGLKQPRRWEDSHVSSQDGNGLVPICPESLVLEVKSKLWEREGQDGGGRGKIRN